MAQVVTRGPHEGSDQDEVLEFRLSSGMKLRNQFTTPQIPQVKVPLTPPLPAPFLPSSCHQHSHDMGSDLSNPVSVCREQGLCPSCYFTAPSTVLGPEQGLILSELKIMVLGHLGGSVS